MLTAALKRRSTPQQARSRATMERVLQASADLLHEVGVDGFNTNLLAERAGVGVRAIYRYFPNKLAILVAMAEQLRETEHAWIGDLRALASGGDWRAAVDQSIDGYYRAASTHRGYAALRAASQAVPELRAIDMASSQTLQDELATGLTGLGVSLAPEHLNALCHVIIESANRILDIALQSPPEAADLLVRELKHMIVNLLADYVE
ncbi:MAG: TetR/AcrR family transcriptional regulator [Caulobacteraceae bacterium]|nr:TetR/AcrR family transcriptional regulator [Caulobacteraceae bacterium]